MGINHTHSPIHWNYFLALEDDLDRLARYVDLSKANENTFSIEIARLLLSSSAEVDVVLKLLCKKIDPTSNALSINSYFPIINNEINEFKNFEITIPRFGLSLKPWSNWTDNTPPLWWQAHNKVKHHRDDHFEKATIKNCVNALAALYIAVLYIYRNENNDELVLQLPKLLHVADGKFGGASLGVYGITFRHNV